MAFLNRLRVETIGYLQAVVTILIATFNVRLTSAIEISTCAAFGDLHVAGNPFLSVFLTYDGVTNSVISLQASNGDIGNFAETKHKLCPFCGSELQGISFTVPTLSGYDCLSPLCNYLFYCDSHKCIMSYTTTSGEYKSVNTIYVTVTNSPVSTCLVIPYLQSYNASASTSSTESGNTINISSDGLIGLITAAVVTLLICMLVLAIIRLRRYKLNNTSTFKQGIGLPPSTAGVNPGSHLLVHDEQDQLDDSDGKAHELKLSRRDSVTYSSKMRDHHLGSHTKLHS